jgi:hypothetical protein
MKSKLILIVSILTGFVIYFTSFPLIESINGHIISDSVISGNEGSGGAFVGNAVFATLIAMKLNWYLKGHELSYEQDVGWNTTLYGLFVWYLIMYVGSRLYISPPFVNQILGVLITALVIFVFHKIFYKPEVDSLNKAAKAIADEKTANLKSQSVNPTEEQKEANKKYKEEFKKSESKQFIHPRTNRIIQLEDTSLFKWKDVTQYCIYDEWEAEPPIGIGNDELEYGPAVLVTDSDGIVEGYIVKENAKAGDWTPFPAYKIFERKGEGISREEFLRFDSDRIIPDPPKSPLFSWDDDDAKYISFYNWEGQPAIVIEHTIFNIKRFYIPNKDKSTKWKATTIKIEDLFEDSMSRDEFLDMFKKELKLSS